MTGTLQRWTGSYRIQLAIGYLLIVAVFASAWAWSLFEPLTSAVVEQQEQHLQAVAQAGVLVLGDTEAGAQGTAEQLVARTDLRLTIIGATGVVLADSAEDPESMENHGSRPEIAAAMEGDTGVARRVSTTLGTEQLYVAVPASYAGERVVLRVASPLGEVNAVASQARRTGLVLLVLALIFAAVVVTQLVRAQAQPISQLTRAAQAMADGRLNTEVPPATGELSMLSDALEDLRHQMRHRLDDLEAEERNLRSVLDGLSDAVFLLRSDRISYANRAADELFTRPPTGWKNRAIDNAGLPASIAGGVMRAVEAVPMAFDCGPDASGRVLSVTAMRITPTDDSVRILVTVSDITERARVDRMRRDFVANASHELKTPTAAIQLLAESAADAASHGEADQAVEFARQIAGESTRLSNLVRDLLDLSRLENAESATGSADMRAAIENALLGHRNAATDSGLELNFDDELPGADAYAQADSTDAAVALDNLLDNAIKYTESGSVTVSLRSDEDEVVVSVTDTGVGIPSEDLPRIFERFYRVDRARSRDSGGTGLGLSLVRHVVERSAGSLDVTSEPEVGSTFTITFPRAG